VASSSPDPALVGEQIFLATDTAKLMREVSLTPPTSASKTCVIMGKIFDPSKPDDYVKSFAIKRA
jgi:nitrate/nitrite transport system substrate-binding protein